MQLKGPHGIYASCASRQKLQLTVISLSSQGYSSSIACSCAAEVIAEASSCQIRCSCCRESVHKLAKDGYLFVTWANHHYTDFAMSWVAHLQQLGLSNYLVGAMDDDILATLARRGVPTFSMQSGG